MNGLPRGGYHSLVGRGLQRVWQWLISFGALHTGTLYYEDSQVVAALGQVGCFVDSGTASRGRPPEQLLTRGLRDAGLGGPGAADPN